MPSTRPAFHFGIELSTLTASRSSDGSTLFNTLMWVISPSGWTMNEHSTRPCMPLLNALVGYLRDELMK